jgi:hypothetical protein
MVLTPCTRNAAAGTRDLRVIYQFTDLNRLLKLCKIIQYDSHGIKLPSNHMNCGVSCAMCRHAYAHKCTHSMTFENKVLRTLFKHGKEKEKKKG